MGDRHRPRVQQLRRLHHPALASDLPASDVRGANGASGHVFDRAVDSGVLRRQSQWIYRRRIAQARDAVHDRAQAPAGRRFHLRRRADARPSCREFPTRCDNPGDDRTWRSSARRLRLRGQSSRRRAAIRGNPDGAVEYVRAIAWHRWRRADWLHRKGDALVRGRFLPDSANLRNWNDFLPTDGQRRPQTLAQHQRNISYRSRLLSLARERNPIHQRLTRGAKRNFIPRNLVRREVPNLARLLRRSRLLGARLRDIRDDRRDRIGSVGIDSEQPLNRDAHPDLFERFACRCLRGCFAQIDVTAGQRPFPDLRRNRPPEQQHFPRVYYEAFGDQLRPREIDKAALRANLETLAVGQHSPQLHLAPAQRAEADVMRILMLDMVIWFDWIVVAHSAQNVRRRSRASAIRSNIAATTNGTVSGVERSNSGRVIASSCGDGLRRPPVADANCSSRL